MAENKSIYNDCKHIIRSKPDVKVTEEVAKAIGSNYRTLPSFEKGLFDYVYIKHYSLERNEFLKCRWKKYKQHIEEKVFAPFQFPSLRDLHFYNGCICFLPSESINHRPSFRMKLKPGPGVDFCGQMPIPNELFMKRGRIEEGNARHIKETIEKKSVEKK